MLRLYNYGKKIKTSLHNKLSSSKVSVKRLKAPQSFTKQNQRNLVPTLVHPTRSQRANFSTAAKPQQRDWSWLKLLGVGTGIVSGLQFLLWLYEEKHKNATPVDVGWTYGLGILGLLYAAKGKGHPEARLLTGLVSAAWSFRLGTYLVQTRLLKHSEEDERYKTLRKKWGENSSRNFFLFFQAQALADILFSIPLLLCCSKTTKPGNIQKIAALLVGFGSILGESLADHQLSQFKKNPENKGKVCQEGLWHYSRHPNYFFEFTHWWTYVILMIPSKYWLLSLVSPATMLFLLFKVTGIPATEAQAISSKGDKYREYQKTTSQFVPWFPKKN